MADVLIWTLLSYLCGAMPFSYWIGLRVLRADASRRGAGDLGVAGRGWALVAWLFDFAKGAIPVAAARDAGGLSGWEIVPIALAPIVGHLFSAFLRFRGGRSIAVTFGVWTALTLYQAPIVLAVGLTLAYALVSASGWAVMLAMLLLLGWALVAGWGAPLLATWSGNVLLMAWKYRRDLQQRVGLRPWVARWTLPRRR